MKLRYKGDFNLSSVQKSFKGKDSEEVYDLTDVDGKYLLNTFKGLFEEIVEQKIVKPLEQTEKIEETKTETQVEKPTENSIKTKAKNK